ncbi:PEP-CTERM sorting domain-containing protein [Paucibacter sp. KCTC 42545]|uniref:PEP-CTERM sorting domain-containing protein n=1 Tax=Paucibacter sp. KCTC 42545 TaxID=1768242 RepID=UPI000733B466|nr:PEP-CTERM sorting domain-containing protein [Paucibacter sp. KCTC 42545]ALT76454.1 hypothetical protein AT984_03770 [Paucibacter sp. KCTC 42545]
MKLTRLLAPSLSALAAVALFSATPAFAENAVFNIDFEHNWAYDNSAVSEYYNGGTAADGSSNSANLGVSFVGVFGLSNDELGPYFNNAPTPLGTAYVDALATSAYINVAAGVTNSLSFYYASPTAVVGAIKAYSGLNGTGTLLGTFDLAANGSAYDVWSKQTISFNGTAQSFDLVGSAGTVGFDNISAVPEPSALALMLAGVVGLAGMRNRRRG